MLLAYWVSGHFLTDLDVHYLWGSCWACGRAQSKKWEQAGRGSWEAGPDGLHESGRAAVDSPGPHSTFRYLVKRLYSTRSVDFRSQLTMSAERQNSSVAMMVPCHSSLILIYLAWSSDATHGHQGQVGVQGWVGVQ